jgi:hypothetical protein
MSPNTEAQVESQFVRLTDQTPDPNGRFVEFLRSVYWGEHRNRFNGDQVLLSELEDRIRYGRTRPQPDLSPEVATAAARYMPGSDWLTVGELSDAELVDVVERVAEREPGWRLYGDESVPIRERLDEHFRPLQEAHARCVAEAQAKTAERVRTVTASTAAVTEEVAAGQAKAVSSLWGV